MACIESKTILLRKRSTKNYKFDFVEIVVLLVWELDFVRKESAQDEQLALREELDDVSQDLADEGDQRLLLTWSPRDLCICNEPDCLESCQEEEVVVKFLWYGMERALKKVKNYSGRVHRDRLPLALGRVHGRFTEVELRSLVGPEGYALSAHEGQRGGHTLAGRSKHGTERAGFGKGGTRSFARWKMKER